MSQNTHHYHHDPRDDSIMLVGTPSNESSYSSLTLRQRIIFYVICLIIGTVAQSYAIWTRIHHTMDRVTFFMVCISGITIHMFGPNRTTFLASPKKQLDTITNKDRFPALIFYTLSVIITLYLGFIGIHALLIMGFLVLEVCTYMWYCFWWSIEAQSFRKSSVSR